MQESKRKENSFGMYEKIQNQYDPKMRRIINKENTYCEW